MKKVYKKRLATLAIALLESRSRGNKLKVGGKKLEFRMNAYGDITGGGRELLPAQVNVCGTVCCLAGFAPHVFPATRKMYSWNDVLIFLIGNSDADVVWDFLFSPSWPNDPKQAAARVLWFLDNKCNTPAVIDEAIRYHNRMSEQEITEKLSTYL